MQVTGVYYASAALPPHPNYTEHVVKLDSFGPEVTKAYLKSAVQLDKLNSFLDLLPKYINSSREIVQSPAVQEIIRQEYDVLIATSGVSSYVAEVVQCPLVFLAPPGPVKWYTDFLGNPFNPAITPHTNTVFQDPHSFRERLWNLLTVAFYDGASHVLFGRYVLPKIVEGLDHPPGITLARGWEKYGTLLLSNSHPVTNEPQPLLVGLFFMCELNVFLVQV